MESAFFDDFTEIVSVHENSGFNIKFEKYALCQMPHRSAPHGNREYINGPFSIPKERNAYIAEIVC